MGAYVAVAPRHPGVPQEELREERHEEAREDERRADDAPALGVHAPRDLREPVVERREPRGERSADHDEVEMGHDEVGVVPVDVEALGRRGDARHPAEDEEEEEREEVDERRPDDDRPLSHREHPGEDLDGAEDGDEHRENAERRRVEERHAGDEHVVPPRRETDERDAERGVGDGLVGRRVLVAERGDDLADDPHRRQDHDVDGRVRVEPEEVLVEHGVAAARRVEEPPVEPVVDADDAQRHGEHGRRQHLDDADAVHGPHEERHAQPGRRPWRASCGSSR